MPELKELISAGAGTSLEFIPHIENQNHIAQTIVAFANTQGGKLLVGVKDNGKIVGVFPNEELQNLEELIENCCDPRVEIESTVHQEGRHLVLEIQIPKSDRKHKAIGDDGQLKFYHRLDKHTLSINRVIIQLWKLQDQGSSTPNSLDIETTDVIELIKENQPVTISKLFRLSGINKNRVNEIMANLIHWNLVDCEFVDSAIEYAMHK